MQADRDEWTRGHHKAFLFFKEKNLEHNEGKHTLSLETVDVYSEGILGAFDSNKVNLPVSPKSGAFSCKHKINDNVWHSWATDTGGFVEE